MSVADMQEVYEKELAHSFWPWLEVGKLTFIKQVSCV
jgi:hypothetical protein